ncbi:MAG TPA: cation diffusion facilitator family transporter [Roseiflexaceae bacterium]|jgi:cation diffusion facilitator family transporter|nr:cation diffusion facilitator family transporter [Roseiflexaceae bacterium]
MGHSSLTRYAWLSIGAAILTIGLKAAAYMITGSVGLLSDALESLVNLVAALMALAMLTLAARPPDESHTYGYTKAEYFSSGLEGALIVLAAVSIGWTAWGKLLAPEPLEQIGFGIGLSLVGTAINFGVARVLRQAGKRYHSITLEADADHLMTDVWTSAGVLIGIGAVVLTGWTRLDPIIALLVAANIVWTGVQLVRRSALGLLDSALPPDEQQAIQRVLLNYSTADIQFHALRTRQAGARRFMSVHVLVPGAWTVHHGHHFLEQVERDIRAAVPNITVFTHLESLDDPASWQDETLDRTDTSVPR